MNTIIMPVGTALVLLLFGISCGPNTSDLPPYLNTSLSFEERATDLVARMTLDEKILQMHHEARAIPRLGIPYYNWSSECLHGICNDGGLATVFPQAIGMAATWDVDQVHAVADVISTEARAAHVFQREGGQLRAGAGEVRDPGGGIVGRDPGERVH